jgi:hypothetical protein
MSFKKDEESGGMCMFFPAYQLDSIIANTACLVLGPMY